MLAAIGASILALSAGCSPRAEVPPRAAGPVASAPDLDAEMARASELKRPLLVLIAESGRGGDDDSAIGLLNPSVLGDAAGRVVPVLLDLGLSRNRATAARFHALETPVLLGLSPRGVIVSRDEKPLSKDLVLKRIDEAVLRATEIDAKLATLEEPAGKDVADWKAQLALADFLQEHRNMREAIPRLALVAHSDAADAAPRVRAWVDLALAHLWVAEPEKGRHEAQALIATLGPRVPEALAGGNLVLATQDAKANRAARARREFEEAIAAAPDSDYARRAREGLAGLPKGEK